MADRIPGGGSAALTLQTLRFTLWGPRTRARYVRTARSPLVDRIFALWGFHAMRRDTMLFESALVNNDPYKDVPAWQGLLDFGNGVG